MSLLSLIPEGTPDWVIEECENPRAMGEGRNNQMIRCGPTLLRYGFPEDQLVELFLEMYPDHGEAQVVEIEAVVRNCVKLSDHDGMMSTSEFIAKKDRIRQITKDWTEHRPHVLERYSWPLDQIREDGGGLDQYGLQVQRRCFLEHLFLKTDRIWTGEVWQTGLRKDKAKRVIGDWGERFQLVGDLLSKTAISGEFTSHCTFEAGTYSRCNEAVVKRRYLVTESDVLTPDQVGAIFNFLGNNGLTLRAVVTSGGKSLHGWFDWPGEDGLDSMAAKLTGLGCDPATLKASQPVRLPGIIRRDTGRPQQLLWLNPPASIS